MRSLSVLPFPMIPPPLVSTRRRVAGSNGVPVDGAETRDGGDAPELLDLALETVSCEHPSHDVRRSFAMLRRQLESGRAIDEGAQALPVGLRQLVLAGQRHGCLPDLLQGFLLTETQRQNIRFQMWWALLLPVVTTLAALVICMGIVLFLIPSFKQIFEDFETQLPALTLWVLGISDLMLWVVNSLLAHPLLTALGVAVLAVAGFLAVHFIRRSMTMMSLVYHVPIIGPGYRDGVFAPWCAYLAALYEQRLPLDEAADVLAGLSRNPSARNAAGVLAQRVREGVPPNALGRGLFVLPATLRGILNQSEHAGFPAMLRNEAEVLSVSARSRIAVFVLIVQPIVLIVSGLFIIAVVVASFLPLLKLLNALA